MTSDQIIKQFTADYKAAQSGDRILEWDKCGIRVELHVADKNRVYQLEVDDQSVIDVSLGSWDEAPDERFYFKATLDRFHYFSDTDEESIEQDIELTAEQRKEVLSWLEYDIYELRKEDQ